MASFFSKKLITTVAFNDADICVAQMDGDHAVIRTERMALPEHAMVHGKIADATAVSEVFKKIFEKMDKPEQVVISIPDEQLFTHRFEIAEVPTEVAKLDAWVIAEAEKIIPVASDAVYFDYEVIKDKIQETGTKIQTGGQEHVAQGTAEGKGAVVVYASSPREVVDGFIAVCKEQGCEVVQVIGETFAMGRALVTRRQEVKGGASNGVGADGVSVTPSATLVVSIGDAIATLSIFDHTGTLLVSSTAPCSAGSFARTIGQAVVTSEAGMPVVPPVPSIPASSPSVLETALGLIADEIKKSITYAENRFGEKVAQVILAGELAVIPNSVNYFTSHLGVAVIAGNPLEISGVKTSVSIDQPVLYAKNIGMGLLILDGAEKIISFLPAKHVIKQEIKKPTPFVPTTAPVSESEGQPASLTKKLLVGFFLVAVFGGFGWVVWAYIIKPMM